MTIAITEEKLEQLVAEHVERALPRERIEQLAAERIEQRCREVTTERACELLRCKNLRQLKDKCRALDIPIYRDRGQKSQYLLVADIERAHATRAERVPLHESRGGTAIVSLSRAA